MSNEEKLKLAFFAIVRSHLVAPQGGKLKMSMKEINNISRETAEELLNLWDYEELTKDYYGV